MYICYVDESGGFEAPNQALGATPLMTFVGLIIHTETLAPLTTEFLDLKGRFYPGLRTVRHLDLVLSEVKGSALRKGVRSQNREKRRHSIGVLESTVRLIERYDLQLLGRVWIKDPNEALDPRASYTFAIQDIARHFNHFLESESDSGLVLCDGRAHSQDTQVSHSIFTLKHKQSGDELSRLVEATVFGRSENHVGLQLADILASGLVFPIAARVYCAAHVSGIHAHRDYDVLRTRFSARLRPQQHLYQDSSGRTRGGIVVSDKLGKQPSSLMFKSPAPEPRPLS